MTTTIRAAARDEFTERRSRFIGQIAPACTEEEALRILEETRREHWDAGHNVYAYVLSSGRKRYSDDGEPQGTAGVPVLSVLENEGLTDVCCIVTRYFGGILLGAGGLVRAYSHAAKLSVDAAQKVFLRPCATSLLTLEYAQYGPVQRLLEQFGAEVLQSDFGERVRLKVRLRLERQEPFCREVENLTAGAAVPQVVGEELAETPD